ncbi:MAG: hypothetical protein GXP63_02450 [DPANN group archaeon]|nr:hypothetical protein [DPANN group archaeon]
MIRLILIALVLLIVPSAAALRLAVSPDVLFFGKDRTERTFRVMNPNDEPIRVMMRLRGPGGVKGDRTGFHLSDDFLDLMAEESRQMQVSFDRTGDNPYVEDTIFASVVDDRFPVALYPGVGIRLSAIDPQAISEEDKDSDMLSTATPRPPRTIVRKIPKKNLFVTSAGYTLMVLFALAGMIFGFRKAG